MILDSLSYIENSYAHLTNLFSDSPVKQLQRHQYIKR